MSCSSRWQSIASSAPESAFGRTCFACNTLLARLAALLCHCMWRSDLLSAVVAGANTAARSSTWSTSALGLKIRRGCSAACWKGDDRGGSASRIICNWREGTGGSALIIVDTVYSCATESALVATSLSVLVAPACMLASLQQSFKRSSVLEGLLQHWYHSHSKPRRVTQQDKKVYHTLLGTPPPPPPPAPVVSAALGKLR